MSDELPPHVAAEVQRILDREARRRLLARLDRDRDELYVVARESVDDVMGPGAYARANAGNRDPLVREQVVLSLRAEAVALCRALGCTCEPEPTMIRTDEGLGPYAVPAWISEHGDDCAMVEDLIE